jgi:hypothetical protein
LKEEFKEDLVEQVSDPKISDKLSEIGGKVISSSALNVSDVVSGYSTFGISIGLALLGTFLAKRYRKSKAARIIAKIFGADVEQIDRSYVLQKLQSDPTYFEKVRRGVTEILSKGDLQQLTKYFASEFDLREDEALEVYLQIKDVILDSQIIGSLLQISVGIGEIKNKFVQEFDNMKNAAGQQLEGIRENMDTLVKQQIIKVEEMFIKSLTEFGLSQANFEIWSKNTVIGSRYGSGDKSCWKSGFFTEREIKSNYDVRRLITDTILDSIEQNYGTMLYGRPYDGKTILLKRIMLEEIQKEEYVVLFCDKVVANGVYLKNLLTRITQQFPKILVIIDNAHSSGTEELFKVYNYFLGSSDNTNHTKVTTTTTTTTTISSSLRFLFAARTEEMDQFTSSSLLKIDDKREVEYALRHINGPIEMRLNLDDASRFVQKALEMGDNQDRSPSSSQFIYPQTLITNTAKTLIERSNNDTLMFGCYIRSLISGVGNSRNGRHFDVDDITKGISFVNCLNDDFEEKKIFIDSDQEIRKAAIACSIIGSFDIPLSKEILRICCDVHNKQLEKLAQGYFLKKSQDINNKSFFQIRHPSWALEFLSYLYKELENDFEEFDYEYKIKSIFSSILYHIDLHDIFNILKICVAIFPNIRLKPFSKIIVENFEVPPALTDDQRVVVQEQFAFTLNRTQQSERAERILLDLIQTKRARSETYGILGRVYKDRWQKALKIEDKILAAEYLNKSICVYLKGFEINQYDYYPGINAITLMEIKNPPDEKRKQILPRVRYAVNQQLSSTNKPNYWDYATLLELAVLDKDESQISEIIDNALKLVPDKWQVESTLGNLNIINEAREKRSELGDIEKMVINKLETYINSAVPE